MRAVVLRSHGRDVNYRLTMSKWAQCASTPSRRGRLRFVACLLAATWAGLVPGAWGQATAADAEPVSRSAAVASAKVTAEIERSVVYLYLTLEGYVNFLAADDTYQWSDPLTVNSHCSGFFVSPSGHIASAGHCVDLGEFRADSIDVFLDQQVSQGVLTQAQANELAISNSWKVEGHESGSQPALTISVSQPKIEGAVIGDPITARVLDFQPSTQGDLPLLEIELPETPPLPVASADPQNGSPLTAIGFPGNIQGAADPSRIQRASFKTGTASSQQVSPEGVSRTEINADLYGGMSGGPTVDAQGNVLGVNSAGFVDNQAFNVITDTTDWNDWRTSKGVQPVSARVVSGGEGPSAAASGAQPPPGAESITDDSGGISRGVWILVILVIQAIVVAVLTVLFLRSRKKGPGQPQGGDWNSSSTPSHMLGARLGEDNGVMLGCGWSGVMKAPSRVSGRGLRGAYDEGSRAVSMPRWAIRGVCCVVAAEAVAGGPGRDRPDRQEGVPEGVAGDPGPGRVGRLVS